MSKIIDYYLVTKNYNSDMNEAVRVYLNKGFTPLGGVSIGYAYDPTDEEMHARFAQAMVKYEGA